MGKLKRPRQKQHLSSSNERLQENVENYSTMNDLPLLLSLTPPKENLFAGVNIKLGNLKNDLSNDSHSIKSFNSIKSSSNQIIPKKEKLKLRRKLLLQKIDVVNQMKKEIKLKEKRKNNVIGDTNPLYDALPSLESLLKSRSNNKYRMKTPTNSNKGIVKTSQRKRRFVQGVNVFKQALKNSNFKKNPFEAISKHIKSVVEQERSLVSNKR